MCTHACACVYGVCGMYMYVCMCVHVYVYNYMYVVCVCVCACVHACVGTHVHT